MDEFEVFRVDLLMGVNGKKEIEDEDEAIGLERLLEGYISVTLHSARTYCCLQSSDWSQLTLQSGLLLRHATASAECEYVLRGCEEAS